MLKSNSGKQMQNKALTESATNRPKPGDYPIGSLESRAAARMLAESKAESILKIHIFNIDSNGNSTFVKEIVVPQP
jgi:hypothetical protein